MVDIIHRIGFRATPERVYKAVATLEGLRNWWTDDVEGDEKVGGNIVFTFRSATGDVLGKMVMKVTELNNEKNVRWKCTDGPEEWIGTDITFDLSLQGD